MRLELDHFFILTKPGAPEANLLTASLGSLCADCHDTTEAGFGTAHLGIDPSIMDCMACHDPHASQSAKLFKAEEHAPFAVGSCEDCHEVEGR